MIDLCIMKKYVDFSFFADYQLKECFDFLQVKDFASEKIPFYTNMAAMFNATLRIKMNPLTFYSLVKGTMISLGEASWYLFWIFLQPAIRFLERHLSLLSGENHKLLLCSLE